MIKKITLILTILAFASAIHAIDNNKPESHDASWMVLHGGASKVEMDLCLSCHVDRNDCVICHQEIAPRSHNPTWAGKVHGLKARWDREPCMVCHKQDSCVACHQVATPTTHRPGWGGIAEPVSKQRHCNSCHYPLQDNSCITCHATVHTPEKYK